MAGRSDLERHMVGDRFEVRRHLPAPAHKVERLASRLRNLSQIDAVSVVSA